MSSRLLLAMTFFTRDVFPIDVGDKNGVDAMSEVGFQPFCFLIPISEVVSFD